MEHRRSSGARRRTHRLDVKTQAKASVDITMSLPNIENKLWQTLDQSFNNPYWGELEHYHNFGRSGLYRLLRDTGFEPVGYSVSERYRVGMQILAVKT